MAHGGAGREGRDGRGGQDGQDGRGPGRDRRDRRDRRARRGGRVGGRARVLVAALAAAACAVPLAGVGTAAARVRTTAAVGASAGTTTEAGAVAAAGGPAPLAARNLPADGRIAFYLGQDSSTLSTFKSAVLDTDAGFPRPAGTTLYTNLVGAPMSGLFQPTNYGSGDIDVPLTLSQYGGGLAVGLYLVQGDQTPLRALAGTADAATTARYRGWGRRAGPLPARHRPPGLPAHRVRVRRPVERLRPGGLQGRVPLPGRADPHPRREQRGHRLAVGGLARRGRPGRRLRRDRGGAPGLLVPRRRRRGLGRDVLLRRDHLPGARLELPPGDRPGAPGAGAGIGALLRPHAPQAGVRRRVRAAGLRHRQPHRQLHLRRRG